jgi:predicted ATPase/DNA-binding XRE family transcriptional regulator
MKILKSTGPRSFGAQLKALRDAAGFTQEELAAIAGLSVHAVSALERGQRRRPHPDTVRALSAALDLTAAGRDALIESARTPAPHSAVDELIPASLPMPLTALLGREAEMGTLHAWLDDPMARLITLTGPGGAGKTRLALELARTIAASAPTRVVFVSLASIRHSTFVAPAIAEALGVPDATAVDLPNRARVACTDATLLVLDNFEQVLEAAPLVADLLTSVAVLRILTTSRAPLHVRGEREYVVGPLAMDTGDIGSEVDDLAQSPAVRLFVERARDVHTDFRLTPTNAPTVIAICRRLDALPLAIELAAPWLKMLTADDLLDRLRQDALIPPVGPRDLPERQQTMNATVAWSYQLLDPEEQRVFRRLGALPGRFPIEAAAAVLTDPGRRPALDITLSDVAGLIDRSLLSRTESSITGRPLYHMLETVRAYAGLELAGAGERDDVLERLALYCLQEASLAADGLVGPSQFEWLNRVRDDLDNYRAVLAWLIERGRPEDACDIAWNLQYFWLIRGRAAEGLQWYEQIRQQPLLSPAAELRALVGAAVMLYTQGALDRVRAMLTDALALPHGPDDLSVAAHAENLLGHTEQATGNVHAARDRFNRSLEQFRALAIPWGAGTALIGLARAALAAGDSGEAERLLDEATAVVATAGPWFLNLPLYIRALLAVQGRRVDEVISLVRESLTRSRELHDRFAFIYALIPLAAAASLKGDAAWTARILGARDAVTERTGITAVDKSTLALRAQAEEAARARLGPKQWADAYAAGRRASIDSLLDDIDAASVAPSG